MLFLDEPQDSFSLISFLQMGKSYEANRDGYVYGYSPNGQTDGLMNQLVMFRVPKDQLLVRAAYEFFAGFKSLGMPIWASDIAQRAPVHAFERGWVNTAQKNSHVVQSWVPSVAYVAPLGQYLMVSSGIGCSRDGKWSKASYLGLWTSADPWGPWTQIYENTAWSPGNDPAARCYSPQIAPKWIAPDGKAFWLVWSDFQIACEWAELNRIHEEGEKIRDPQERMRFHVKTQRQYRPYYAFNTQRVDLIVA